VARELKPSRRRYNSPLRAGQAEETRRRVLEGAYRLFVERGYAGTTIAQVAAEARVSSETIYLAFGGKRGLLEGVIELAIVGEGDPPTEENLWWDEVAGLSGARERLKKMIEFSCRVLARTAPIHTIIRGAADKEAFAGELRSRLLHDRVTNQTERVRRFLRNDLRDGISVAGAGQRYCALTSPELYFVLTVELGWSAEQHRAWLDELLAVELLAVPR
jgi:AcrR family transcriptional regulator